MKTNTLQSVFTRPDRHLKCSSRSISEATFKEAYASAHAHTHTREKKNNNKNNSSIRVAFKAVHFIH